MDICECTCGKPGCASARRARYQKSAPTEARRAMNRASALKGQQETEKTATWRNSSWSPLEDKFLRDHPELSAREAALHLHRTLEGVKRHRQKMQRNDQS